MTKRGTARLLIALPLLAGAGVAAPAGMADYIYLHVTRHEVAPSAVSCPGRPTPLYISHSR